MRCSPCTGMKYLGFVSAWMILSSSWHAWPETCSMVRAVVDDLNALAEELVDDTRDGVLVAGDGARRDNDAVAGADLDLLVLGERHAVQGGHLLALRARW